MYVFIICIVAQKVQMTCESQEQKKSAENSDMKLAACQIHFYFPQILLDHLKVIEV